MWCWFTDLLMLLCTSLSKELSQWNEILIKGICMVYCWTFRILSAFPSDTGLKTRFYLKIWCLDINGIRQSKIISPQDQLNTCILLGCPFAGHFLFACFFRSVLFICLGSFLQLFHRSLVLQRWIVLENSAISNLVGFRKAHCSLLFGLQISLDAVASTKVMHKLPLKPIWLI